MNIKSIITAALALLFSTACSGGTKQEKVMANDGKTLVVYFSHAGDNYAVGNIEVGNTKIVADYITELTGAERFEIVTHKYDGMAYTPLINLAKEEAGNGELPEYEGDVDLKEYDTVFIGGPVWWGTYPQVMFTFFKKHANDLEKPRRGRKRTRSCTLNTMPLPSRTTVLWSVWWKWPTATAWR